MKVFYATQFIERGRDIPMKLVSAGFVREDGAALYVINEENLSSVMMNRRLGLGAVTYLPIASDPSPGTLTSIYRWDDQHAEYQHVLPLTRLIDEVRQFLTEAGPVELWAHHAAHQHVVLVQLFGELGEGHIGIPMWTHELEQLIEAHPMVALPEVTSEINHSMTAAYWLKEAYELLTAPAAPRHAAKEIEVNDLGYVDEDANSAVTTGRDEEPKVFEKEAVDTEGEAS